MFNACIVAVAMQVAVAAPSPLQHQGDLLVNAPSEVKYEFIKQIITDYGVTEARFRHLPQEVQEKAVRRAYYIGALSKALLLHQNIKPLTDILNTMGDDQDDWPRVALAFEARYHEIFRKWPPIVPVDLDALINRMLSEKTVR